MTNELTTTGNKSLADFSTEYVIVFHGGNTMEITGEQHEVILDASCQPNSRLINVNNQTINFASISQILSLSEYYKQYPDKMPEQRDIFKPMTMKELHGRALAKANVIRNKGILKGLEEFRDGKVDGVEHKSSSVLNKIEVQRHLLEKAEKELSTV